VARTKFNQKKSVAKQMERRAARKKKSEVRQDLLLAPTPSTLLNLAMSDDPFGGAACGRMVNLIGDSSSGKSIIAFSLFADANKMEEFDDYRFIYDDAENANSFDEEYLFGKETADRIEPPSYTTYDDGEEDPTPSHTIEDFHCNIMDALDDERPFIYILDSFDAIDSEQDQCKVEEMRKARKKGNKDTKGSYGLSKPRKSSEILRSIVDKVERSNSILIIVSQTRDNINPMSPQKTTRSGGRALKFYATHEIWLVNLKAIKNSKYKKVIGHNVMAKVSKNKLTGKVREISFCIFYDYGVDDITSCINFMVDNGGWKKKKNTIEAKELKISGTKQKLVELIEKKNLEDKLKRCVGKLWNSIEEEIRLGRKPKY